jgi:hypothetical protein
VNLLTTIRRFLGLAPRIYIHSSYLSPKRLALIRELYAQITVWKWQDGLTSAIRSKSVFFDSRYGLVGDGDDSLIQVKG